MQQRTSYCATLLHYAAIKKCKYLLKMNEGDGKKNITFEMSDVTSIVHRYCSHIFDTCTSNNSQKSVIFSPNVPYCNSRNIVIRVMSRFLNSHTCSLMTFRTPLLIMVTVEMNSLWRLSQCLQYGKLIGSEIILSSKPWMYQQT